MGDQQFALPDGAVIRRDDVVGPDSGGACRVLGGHRHFFAVTTTTIKAPRRRPRGDELPRRALDNDVTEDEVERSSVSHATDAAAGARGVLRGARSSTLRRAIKATRRRRRSRSWLNLKTPRFNLRR